MGNRNSESEREIRRNTRKWQQFADNHDQSGRGAAVIEQTRRISRMPRKKIFESSKFTVDVGQNGGSRGFKIEEKSLMIIDITNPLLQRQRLPEGSIIREIDGVPVYDYHQFCTHITNKSKYTLTVLTPTTTGVWKVSPFKHHRKIVVHKETLVVYSTTIPNFPREPQVVKSVNGCHVRGYTEYESLIADKTKFFITVVPARRDDINSTSISAFLSTVNREPDSLSEFDKQLIRKAVEESIDEVNSEINWRMQKHSPFMNNFENKADVVDRLDQQPATNPSFEQPKQEERRSKKKKKRSRKKSRR